MTNPFSPSYKPVVDLSDVTRENNISRKHSAIRQAKLTSGDPVQATQAAGFIQGMKSVPMNKSILKSSKLG
ncbi:MAG: hypothetical protein ACM3VZ_11500 [Acidobacteriota bacterium]